MLPPRRTSHFRTLAYALILGAVCVLFARSAGAASLPVFAVVFGQVTNEIGSIQAEFDNSAAQKQRLATLVRARGVILHPELRDEQALAALVELLGSNNDYVATLDESARNARASVLGSYDLLGVRVGDLPPSPRSTAARNRFEALAAEASALANAQHAAGISALLAPFGRQLESIRRLVDRATTMPVPRTGQNSVRAQVDSRRFVSAGEGAHSPNSFEVSAPDPLYRQVFCRVVDGPRVLTFTLPIVTEQVRYEVAQGLAALTYTPDVFAPGAMAVSATNGTFFVQSDRNEIFGVFTAAGPGFAVANGRFRIKLPSDLRGND